MKLKTLSILASLAAITTLAGCSKADDPREPGNRRDFDNRHYISLSLGGDFITQSDIPLTRESDRPTYMGVNVKFRLAGSKDSYTPYAYGMFTDESKMNLEIESGYEYAFEVMVMINGTDSYYTELSSYGVPFKIGQLSYSKSDLNKFVMDNSICFNTLTSGTAHVSTPNTTNIQEYKYPRVDRYYGEKEGYQYSHTSNNVQIEVYRKNFGIKVVAKNLPESTWLSWDQTNATQSVQTGENNPYKLQFGNARIDAGSSDNTWSEIYSLTKLKSGTEDDIKLVFTWHRSATLSDPMTFTFKPEANVTKLFTLDFDNAVSTDNGSISISVVTEPWTVSEQNPNLNQVWTKDNK